MKRGTSREGNKAEMRGRRNKKIEIGDERLYRL